MEPTDDKITVTQELFLAYRRNGTLVAVEQENGKIERWITEQSSSGKSAKAFGADKPPQKLEANNKSL